MITADDIKEFNAYLRQCTDAQVIGVIEHESTRGGDGPVYAELAKTEASHRNLHYTK